jgi:hypothetical protein
MLLSKKKVFNTLIEKFNRHMNEYELAERQNSDHYKAIVSDRMQETVHMASQMRSKNIIRQEQYNVLYDMHIKFARSKA